MKRIFIVLLAACLLAGILPMSAWAAESTPVWDGRSSEAYAGGTGTEEDPYQISNGAQLYQLVLDAGDDSALTAGKYYKLTRDIDLGENLFPGIARFGGTLDGANHTIRNLCMINTASSCTGLIRSGSSCTIRNLTVEGTISGRDYVGSIIGSASNCLIENCKNYCSVSGADERIGGICGSIGGTTAIHNCQNYGAVSSEKGRYIGGICGYTYTSDNAIIQNCSNAAPVTGKSCTSGIVGFIDGKATIKNCSNVGSVTGGNSTGGICGYTDASGQLNIAISRCANAGKITGTNYVGGILGYAYHGTDISNCYNCGDIHGSYEVGGILACGAENYYHHNGVVATNSGYNDITSSYNCGTVTGSPCYDTTNSHPDISNAYYLSGINESATNPSGGTGLTSEQMTSVGGFVGFDFSEVWTWDSANIYKYPILRSLGVVLAPCEEDQHTWNEGTVVDAATCTEEGELLLTCTTCAATKNQVITALEHDIIIDKEVPPTCLTPGLSEGSHCSRCDLKEAQQTLPAPGHNMITDKAVPPTCTEPGLTEGSHCSRCDYVIAQEPVKEKGHNYTSQVTPPTCDDMGFTTHTCENCSDSYIDSYTNATGHDWDEGTQTLDPTCDEEGTKLYTCGKCGDTKEEPVGAIGHSYTPQVTPPTCDDKGFTTHTCGNCGDSYIDSYTNATGHDWDKGTQILAPTCTEEGTKLYTCGNCGDTKEESIDAKDHKYTSVVTKPTCTATGYTTHTCRNCNDSYKDTYVGATGHAWNDGIEVTSPTCTEKGSTVFTCGNCGATKDKDIPALGHSHEAKTTSPTCVDGGFTVYTCTTCGDHYTDDLTDPTGHSYTDGICTGCGAADPNPANRTPFEDVPVDKFFYEPVVWAYTNNITTGKDATHFNPSGSCTRAQVVTFLWRAAGEPEPTSTANPFPDVANNKYYTKAVLWAVEKGITAGFNDGTFGPDNTCTRAQIVTFLWRYAGQPEPESPDNPFPDVYTTAYYGKAVLWAVEKGITTGYKDGTFGPGKTCTRDQIVTFLWRAIA